MGRKSGREEKNIYLISREEANMTRAEASEALEFISESRLEKIESEKTPPHPEDIMAMARVYRRPALCNYYCTHECDIGIAHIPAVREKGLSQIVIGMLATLNALNREKERLVEITEDEQITDDELPDFARIQDQLDKISLTVESLKIWVDKAIAEGGIDREKLSSLRKEQRKGERQT